MSNLWNDHQLFLVRLQTIDFYRFRPPVNLLAIDAFWGEKKKIEVQWRTGLVSQKKGGDRCAAVFEKKRANFVVLSRRARLWLGLDTQCSAAAGSERYKKRLEKRKDSVVRARGGRKASFDKVNVNVADAADGNGAPRGGCRVSLPLGNASDWATRRQSTSDGTTATIRTATAGSYGKRLAILFSNFLQKGAGLVLVPHNSTRITKSSSSSASFNPMTSQGRINTPTLQSC